MKSGTGSCAEAAEAGYFLGDAAGGPPASSWMKFAKSVDAGCRNSSSAKKKALAL